MEVTSIFKLTPVSGYALCFTVFLLVCDISNGFDNREHTYLKSNKRTRNGENSHLLNTRTDNVHTRKRRDLPTSDEIRLYVEKHNELRRLEGSSNMHILKWNNELAEMSLLWAEGCSWWHGQPNYPNPPFDPIGQNLYVTNGNTLDIENAIQIWYDEKPFYHPEDQSCDEGEQCGHYTQIVWDVTEEVGCAIAFCDSMAGLSSVFHNSLYLVCNYGPAGNYPRAPYSVGDACTECNSGRFWCDDGLCRSDCTGPGNNCECKADCKNCATTDSQTCTCVCSAGWTGVDCSTECGNYHEWCGANPGWPRSWCTDTYPYVLENCPLLCDLCERADSSTGNCETSTTTTTTTSTTTTTTVPSTTTTSTTRTVPSATTTTTTTRAPSTTTTTTTTTVPSSTTTTTAQPTTTEKDCSEHPCVNGETVVSGNECECQCNDNWQGDTCEHRKDEARVGVIVRIITRISNWEIIWPYLNTFLVSAINSYCNDHVDVCCPGATVTQSDVYLSYLTQNEIVLGEGYPVELVDMGVGNTVRYLTVALFYAFGAQNNDLCANHVTERRKREIPETTLSQETLYEIVSGVEESLQQQLQDCCGVQIDSIERGQVDDDVDTDDDEDDDNKDDDSFLGLQYWAWAVIGISFLSICLIIFLICCIWCTRKRSQPSKYLQKI